MRGTNRRRAEELSRCGGAQLGEPLQRRLDVARSNPGTNRFPGRKTRNHRLARSDDLPGRCALAVVAGCRKSTGALNQRFALRGRGSRRREPWLLRVRLDGTDAEREQQSAEDSHR